MPAFTRVDLPVHKNFHGVLVALTKIRFTGTNRVLNIETSKNGRGILETMARGAHIEGSMECTKHSFGSLTGGAGEPDDDYYVTVKASAGKARVTEKVLLAHHAEALKDIDGIIERCVAFYAAKGK